MLSGAHNQYLYTSFIYLSTGLEDLTHVPCLNHAAYVISWHYALSREMVIFFASQER